MSDPSVAPAQASAVAETVVGGVLIAAPWWVQLLGELNAILAFVTALCGAIVGVAGVMRLFRTRRTSHSSKP
jgi:NADH:ubiquinone oxidoreductase subunit K